MRSLIRSITLVTITMLITAVPALAIPDTLISGTWTEYVDRGNFTFLDLHGVHSTIVDIPEVKSPACWKLVSGMPGE